MKYLITSFDDMRDVISMVWGMMGAKIDAEDKIESAQAIVPASIPLRADNSSFIITLKVPEEIWKKCHGNKQRK